nr:ulp1 protease family, C-terminal catalytic domain-containing protein [Tanacetum cinerariifolium]
KLRAQARARGQKQITHPRVGPKGYRGFKKQWEEERNDPDKAIKLHLILDLRSSNYYLAWAPRDKVGIKPLPAELIDVSKKGVGCDIGYKKEVEGYVRKKRTSKERKDNEEIRNEVRQQMKEELNSSDFLLEMRAKHKKLRKGHMKVAVLKVMEKHKNMELPVSDDELPYLESSGTSKPPITEVPTKRLMPQHERAPSSKKGKVNDTPKEPNKKDKASEDTTNKQKSIQRVENEKAVNRKRLQDLENDILTKPIVFCQTDEFYFALNATDIIELLTYTELELGILTLFEMSLYQLKDHSSTNKLNH